MGNIFLLLFVGCFIDVRSQLGVTTCTLSTQANCPNFLPNSYCNLNTLKCECPTVAGYVDDGSGVACTYDCGAPAAPVNGQVDASHGTFTDDVATYTCNTTYKMTGTASTTCVADSGWDNTETTCVPIEIGDDCSTSWFNCDNIPNANCVNLNTCECISGFEDDGTGLACRDIDDCSPDPCLNGGTCVDGINDYSCVCADVHVEKDCQTKCAPLTSPLYGSFTTTNGTSRGSTATFSCEEGFSLTGVDTLTCLDTDVWSDTEPVCNIVDCGYITIPVNGDVIQIGDSTYGSNVEFYCYIGYTLNGSASTTCQSNGRWSSPSPSCDLVDCGAVPNLFDGTITLDQAGNTSLGATATVSCDIGYTESTLNITCLDIGQWETAICLRIDCGAVPNLFDGTITLDQAGNTSLGATATVSCDIGYTESTLNITCLDIGQWETAICLRIDCGYPDIYFDYNYDLYDIYVFETYYGDYSEILCYNGDTLYIFYIVCQADGTWSNISGCNPVDCGPLSDPVNGQVEITNDTFSAAVAYFYCDVGFTLNGSDTLFCQNDKTWNDSIPVCNPIDCGEVPIISHGIIILDDAVNTTYRATASVTCDIGYTEDTHNITCLDTGVWENATCQVVDCGEVPNISDGIIILDDAGNTTYRATASVTCDIGYTPDTPDIMCLESSQWENATCLIIDCGEVPFISNSIIILDDAVNTTYRATASVTCDIGYTEDTHNITCLDTGVWENATCQVVDCGEVPNISDGIIILDDAGNTTYRATATVMCDIGYTPDTPDIMCLESSQWENATCLIIDCGEVPIISNSIIILDDAVNTTYRATATVTCDVGYIEDTHNITCLDTGFWENATCQVVDCGEVPNISDGIIILDDAGNTTYRATATVMCDIGYTPDTPDIMCLESSQWENATCLIIDCGEVPIISNGIIILDDAVNTTYRATATVTCDVGYTEDTRNITCLDTGVWENATCQVVDCGEVPNISDGIIILDDAGNTTYRATASVTCDIGYTPDTPDIMCLESSQWENATCLIIDCGDVPIISNSVIILDDAVNTTYRATATVTCDVGYIEDTHNITCLDTGFWENATCQVVDCGEVPNISDGIIILDDAGNTTYRATATVTCDIGYTPDTPDIMCLESSQWENATCLIIDCGEVPIISNGIIILDDAVNTTYRATATVTCDVGYTEDTRNITCLDTGVWENATCQVVDCGEVPNISDGIIILDDAGNTTYRTTASVTCDIGYTPDTPDIMCLESSQWENATCLIIDCGEVPIILNGIIILDDAGNTTYRATATVTCDIGYTKDTHNITCLDTGVWENSTCQVVDCEPLVGPVNGFVDFTDGTVYNSTAYFVCGLGYILNGSDAVICQFDGTWNDSSPVCDVVECGLIASPVNGSVDLSEGTTFGSNATFSCYEGFTLTGSESVTCQADASWSSSTPDCTINDCIPTEPILNGNIDLTSGNVYGSTASFTCNPGYSLNGSATLSCQADGTWNGSSPECNIKDCGELHPIANGTLELTTPNITTYGSTATVTCDIGYNTSTPSISCKENGSWEPGVCIINDCGELPSIDNGILEISTPNQTIYGSTAMVTCDMGYNASKSSISCHANGVWEQAFCIINDCGTIENPANGTVNINDGTLYLSNASFICDEGFTLIGSTFAICSADGNWSSSVPICDLKDCGLIASPVNGSVDLSEGTTFSSNATFSCYEGFTLTGSESVTCQADASWSSSTPDCTINDCIPTEPLLNGNINLTSGNVYGSTASFTCNPGYSLNGSATLSCQADGTWNGSSPECNIKDCGELPPITNGTLELATPNLTTYGSTATVTCDIGYNTSTPSISCKENGAWEPGVCIINDCGELPTIDNGLLEISTPNQTIYGSTAMVKCDIGYKPSKSSISCHANGVWEQAFCIIKDCGTIENPANGTVNISDGTFYLSNASFVCDDGFTLIGSAFATCFADGNWSSSVPICDPKDCGLIASPVNGSVDLSEGTTFSSNATFSCYEGFTLTGSESVTCQADASWSSSTPNCTINDCIPTEPLLNGNIDLTNGNVYGSTASFTCNPGYSLNGSATLSCQADGTWNGSSPECNIKDCGELPPIANGTLELATPNLTTYGSTATVTCNIGYNTSTPSISCKENGAWEPGVCIINDCGELPTIDNGLLEISTPNQTIYGSTAMVKCDIGYKPSKSSISCHANGVWEQAFCIIKDCGTIENPANGTVNINDGTFYLSNASFICDDGFTLIGSAFATCSADGNWSSSVPICDPKDCGLIATPVNGSVDLSEGTTFSSNATFSCYEGFTLTGSESVTCQADASWSSSTPNCTINDCIPTEPLLNGNIDLTNGNVYGSTALFTCNPGYSLNGSATLSCQADGTWNGSSPECNIKDCGELPPIANGTLELATPNLTTYGSTATVTCNIGYNTSTPSISCKENGAWEPGVCIINDCGELPTIDNGLLEISTPNQTINGSTAMVKCDIGYNPSKSSISCHANGVWELAFCIIKDCGTIENPANGTVNISDGTFYLSNASFICDEGFTLIGSAFATCSVDGNWSLSVPMCDPKDCGLIASPVNGSVDLSKGTTFSSNATFSCYEGFTLTGSESVTCQADASWSSSTPNCTINDCIPTEPLLNGNIDLTNGNVYGSTASFTCDPGYSLNGSATLMCQADGTWNGSSPECNIKDCGELHPIANGTLELATPNLTTYGSTATVTCDIGYNTSTPSISCQENGSWEPGVCIIIDCGSPASIAYGGLTLTMPGVTTYGSTALVVCDAGYNTSLSMIVCQANGTWESATCVIIDCGRLSNPQGGNVDFSNGTIYGSEGYFTCNTGFILNGSNSSVCQADGTWNNSSPECNPVDCGVLQGPQNGTVDLTEGTTFGVNVSFSCDKGFTLNGSISVTCQADGNWSTPSPVCKLNDCVHLDEPINGHVNLTIGNLYGSTAMFTCNPGFILNGPDSIKCEADGTWTNISVTCDPIDCGILNGISNGTVEVSNGTKFRAFATYRCDNELDLVGDETRVCQDNGKWSGTKPVCVNKESKRCDTMTDARGTTWQETIAGQTRIYKCLQDFNGNMSRYCTEEGIWQLPLYDCIREAVSNVIGQINLLDEAATQNDFKDVLTDLELLTDYGGTIEKGSTLTDSELTEIASSLGKISQMLNVSSNLINEELVDSFLGSASNLVSPTNVYTWTALSQRGEGVAETVLGAVDTLSEGIGRFVELTGEDIPPIVKDSIALHAKKVSSEKFSFPNSDEASNATDVNWLSSTVAKVQVQPASLQGNGYAVVAVIYKDLSGILPDKSDGEKLNGQILSISLTPRINGPIDPAVTLTFQQHDIELTKPTCSFWKFEEDVHGHWSSEGCTVSSSRFGVTECQCNHLTNFAVILSLQDCGRPGSPVNGNIDISEGTTYNSTATYICNDGYTVNGTESVNCLFDGSWSSEVPICSPKDCGPLEHPTNGRVETLTGTIYRSLASYICDEGYKLVGSQTRVCLANGSWSLPVPTCSVKEKVIVECEEDVDSRGLTWPTTQAGNTNNAPCQEGYSGLVSRTCRLDGTWQLPRYDCVRENIQEVNTKADSLTTNATKDDIADVLSDITRVTVLNVTLSAEEKLTDGELSVLSTSLKKVGDILVSSDNILNDNITEDFLDSASNLIDGSNQENWKSLSESESSEAETVLKAVDALTEALSKNIKSSEKNTSVIIKKNIAIKVEKFARNTVIFPNTAEPLGNDDNEDEKWIRDTQSSIRLESTSLKNESVEYVTQAVMYRDLSDILPSVHRDEARDSSDSGTADEKKDQINAPVLSLTITPPVLEELDPPITITFQHNTNNLTSPNCVFWQFQTGNVSRGYWDNFGCSIKTTNENLTVCQCNHLTNFAVLMSPFAEADASSKELRILSIICICISSICLLITFGVHLLLWKNVRNDRTTVLMNLCIALLISYTVFLAGADRTESSVACTVIAAVLQYLYLVVFCIMLVEGILIAIMVLYVFKTKSRIKIMLFLAWVIPAAIVGISLGVTETKGYGNENFCWLSQEDGLIWAFVGPALLIIIFNLLCLIIVMRTMVKTKAMEAKKATEKVKTSFRSLCVLVPVIGLSWVLGIFYINDHFYFVQYIFAILNGLQGFFIFLFHCLLNPQVKRAFSLLQRRRSSSKGITLKSTLRSTTREEGNITDSKGNADIGESRRFSDSFVQSTSGNWKDRILEPTISSKDVQFSQPFRFNEGGRLAASFSAESRESLTDDQSHFRFQFNEIKSSSRDQLSSNNRSFRRTSDLSNQLQSRLFSQRL